LFSRRYAGLMASVRASKVSIVVVRHLIPGRGSHLRRFEDAASLALRDPARELGGGSLGVRAHDQLGVERRDSSTFDGNAVGARGLPFRVPDDAPKLLVRAQGLRGDLPQRSTRLERSADRVTLRVLGFSFIFFLLAVSLFCGMQISSLRGEEAEQRLETLLALPVGRSGWLAGRMLLAAAGAAAIALAAGLLAWAGAAAQGADVSVTEMLRAGANTLPPALLFLALGTLAFALAPRASTVIAYGLVGLAFIWELFGALLEVPAWLLAVSPFHDVGLVPGEPFEAGAAAIMLALAASVALAAVTIFRWRDLTTA
jgi:hypothetical protein